MTPNSSRKSRLMAPNQSKNTFRPQEVLRISTLEQLKIISDPLRIKILEAVTNKAFTVKQISSLIQESATKLYYHAAALEVAGFIVVVETRIKSGIIEKYYRATAEKIEVDREIIKGSPEDEVFMMIRTSIFDSTLRDLKHSHETGAIKRIKKNSKDNIILHRSILSLSQQDAIEFTKKFKALVKEYDGLKKDNQSNYVCTMAFFPYVIKK